MQLLSHRGNSHALTVFWLQLRKCGKDYAKKIRKSKEEVKEALIGSIIHRERYGNGILNEKADKVESCEDSVSIVRAYEGIIKNLVCVVFRQGIIFKSFKEKDKFISMITDFGISKPTMIFNTNTLNKYPTVKKSFLSLHFVKNYLKVIKEICKENAHDFNR